MLCSRFRYAHTTPIVIDQRRRKETKGSIARMSMIEIPLYDTAQAPTSAGLEGSKGRGGDTKRCSKERSRYKPERVRGKWPGMFWSIPSTDHSRVQLIDSSRWSSGSGLQTYITIKMNQGDINYWYEREKQGYCKDPASNNPGQRGGHRL